MTARRVDRGRRWWLEVAVVAGAAAVASPIAAQNTDPSKKKYTKERVGYRDEPYLGRSCAKCILYSGHGECAIVEGEVSLNGWCLQWTPATIGSVAPGHPG